MVLRAQTLKWLITSLLWFLPYNESFAVARENGLIPSTIPFCFTEDVYMQILMGGVTYDELEDSGQTFIDGMTINEPYYYDEPPVIQTEAYADHFDLLEQQVALRDKYIMGRLARTIITAVMKNSNRVD